MELNEASKRCKVDDDDIISQLLESILHQILACLPLKEAARTCCLSKTWNDFWNYSSPGLYFSQTTFGGNKIFKSYKTQLIEFSNYIDQRIKHRRQYSNITIQEFQLSLDIKGTRNRVPLEYVRKWLDYAINDNELHKLVVHCHDKSRDQVGNNKGLLPYLLPEFVVAAKSLKELDLLCCKIDTINTKNIKLYSLKKLSLACVHVDQETLEGLFSSCCLVEQVSINKCRGFEALLLPAGLIKLEKVEFLTHTDGMPQSIEIRAPNLRAITYGGNCSGIISFVEGCTNNRINIKEIIFDVILM